ncbi:MAG: hypothetical protein ACSLFN_11325 [Candidatus Limnocylindrales bacterium]
MIRRLAATLSAMSLLVILAAPVVAGGWAEVRIDPATTQEPPVVGTPFGVGFTVLQHGRTPAGWVTPTVRFARLGTATTLDVPAVHETAGGTDGRFRATVTLPEAGYWSWSVSFPELMSDGVAFTLAVQTVDGLVPAPGSTDAVVASVPPLVAPAEPGLPAIGVIALAVLAGGAAGFVMSWLAGRPAPREIDVTFSPAPREADPA